MTLVDNNVLSSLAKIDRLELLATVFDEVATVPAVLDELHSDSVAGYAFVDRIDDLKSYNGGWLAVRSPTDAELALTDEIVDDSLSFTDAQCLAVAEHRNERLLTDDAQLGSTAVDRGETTVWDLPLFLETCVTDDHIETQAELSALLTDLRTDDHYRFTQSDTDRLYDSL
ncbi:MAG: hypothetical protein J07HN4v3_03255 [Halonotius sp. J07HN4]|jgi:hypothetical protein|nr:MAG: hypothetical protein J07HN4v3_03255 [Halonotius sp. J07HN4]